MFQIVAVWNICAFLMSMASLYSLSPDFHPSSASLSSPESLEKLHCDAIEQQGRQAEPSCGALATTPLGGWHTCEEDFSFRVGLLPFLAKMDFLPISTYFESQATPLSKPHGHAILLTSVPSSTLLYLQPKFRNLIFLFLYFLIFLFLYIFI